MAIGVLAATVPMPLVLPLLAVLCVASALVLAALTFVLRRVTGQVAEDDFDVPGVLCLLGFAACIVADAPEALRHLADLGTHAVVEAGLTPMPDKSN